MRYAGLALLLFTSWPLAAAVDDNRFFKLEQDVRNLEARVQDLAREVVDLKERVARPGAPPAAVARPSPAAKASARWLDPANWDRLHAGMSELDVIGVLGLPTSMRARDGGRVLLYATEIGSAGFLSGSVTVRDGAVTEIARPVLK